MTHTDATDLIRSQLARNRDDVGTRGSSQESISLSVLD
jgi:hypothetical protein